MPPGDASGDGDVKKLRKLIKDIDVATLTVMGTDGVLRSRPLPATDHRFDGDLWFVTRAGDDVRDGQRVNVSFASPRDGRFVSFSGVASVVRDSARVKELWARRLKSWFPEGRKAPEIAALRVAPDLAEYWDAETRQMQRLGTVLPPPAVEQRRVDLTDMPEPKGGAQG